MFCAHFIAIFFTIVFTYALVHRTVQDIAHLHFAITRYFFAIAYTDFRQKHYHVTLNYRYH